MAVDQSAQSSQHNKAFPRIVQVARFRIRGLKDDQIARHFDMSASGLARMVGSPEYKEVEEQVLSGVLTELDKGLVEDISALKRKFSTGVPVAVQRLVDIAMQQRDLKMALEASRELLDRDPNRTFAKDSVHSDPACDQRPLPQSVFDQIGLEGTKVASEAMGPSVSEKVQ